ncbi:TIGR03943 family protein [Streptococcus iniae]|uniref:Phosphate ABC transporter substrate-binding protein n=1 Tax=Streptococcus iniae TaxID=1346 RepID=A0A1S1XUG4_STRIN|nr:TIGR03943 family protein [Streptococcus iniae]AHY16104.1 phosphate ABC transporter substrate-binding protein [Streptococcus iniae]AHY17967.1 phosphate ABC transporter substrate-binding protein [Streptococcus iniae]AJG26263.1 phosphate ABC transporter substrate-binding protein [Streptococcus iniae]ASL35091.1 putative membrane spanning protein [Streptococcus iniae]ATX40071.1 Putative two-component membrane permease complex subunit [Streptococcus iniae]
MIRFLVLAAYFELTMYLQLSGKLDQYINIKYSYLAYISMALSFLLALVQLYTWMKNIKVHSHLHGKLAKVTSPMILIIPVFIGLLVPTVSLDSTTVSAKGYHFPLAAGTSTTGLSDDGARVQYLKPDTSLYFTKSAYQREMHKELQAFKGNQPVKITTQNYMQIMELIYLYPDDFANRDIEYTGFVYREPGHDDSQFLFRFGIIHCIADSGVYGLLTKGGKANYPNNTWLTVKGKIHTEYHKALDQNLPVLEIESVHQTQKPDNPYVYRVF